MQHERFGQPRGAGEEATQVRGGAGPVPKATLARVCGRYRLDYDEDEVKDLSVLLTEIRDELRLSRAAMEAHWEERRADRTMSTIWSCLTGIGTYIIGLRLRV